MRRFAGGRNVMLATGDGVDLPAARMRWVFSTALSRAELDGIRPELDRGLSQPPRLVYAGRLSSEKGVAVLVQAISMLKREGFEPLPAITLVGDGPERRALERLVLDLGCDGRFQFAGHCDRSGLSAHLMRADICVQPSLSEGFSKAWLDAMAHGLPVVASDVGAARAVIGPEAVNGRGWLVPPGDAKALAVAIRDAIQAPRDWPALRRRCRAFVEARTLEAWAHQIGDACVQQWRGSMVEGKLSV
jgi:glycosyltransferase involved in cell wall biosynthesis